MPLCILDDDVRSMAQRLAEARGISVTNAVRYALRRELADLDVPQAERDRKLRSLFAKWATDPEPRSWNEADFYDTNGLPHYPREIL